MSNIYSYKTCTECGLTKRSNSRKGFCSTTCYAAHQRKIKIEKWLIGEHNGMRGKTATAPWIKQYVIETRGHKCEDCGNTEWKKQPILLELEHIDGDFGNNKIENLKLLCLNCHGMTPTYRSKNRMGRPREKYYRKVMEG
jgi:endogenous inhibitor of DNA gyrase (YacG/DUF329 family)